MYLKIDSAKKVTKKLAGQMLDQLVGPTMLAKREERLFSVTSLLRKA